MGGFPSGIDFEEVGNQVSLCNVEDGCGHMVKLVEIGGRGGVIIMLLGPLGLRCGMYIPEGFWGGGGGGTWGLPHNATKACAMG